MYLRYTYCPLEYCHHGMRSTFLLGHGLSLLMAITAFRLLKAKILKINVMRNILSSNYVKEYF